jgi:hypothetical protein
MSFDLAITFPQRRRASLREGRKEIKLYPNNNNKKLRLAGTLGFAEKL